MSNDHRAKELANNRFFRETLTIQEIGENKWNMNEKI